MNFTFSKRMDNFETGIFNLLNEKKNELLKQGKKVYNLSVGTPDFKPDKHVMDALIEAASKPENYKYSLSDLPELKQAVINWYKRRYNVELDEDEITSVYGSQEGLTHIGLTFCDAGDIVLVPNPCYPIFGIGPELCGAKLEYYSLTKENNYLPDLDSIPEEIAKSAKMMIVSFPSNPTCSIAPREFYEKLVNFANKYNIIVIHDNAYSEIIYDDNEGISFLSIPGAKDIGVEFNSLSKTYNLTGARISFLLGNKEIIKKFKILRSQIDYGIFYPIQYAAIAALNGSQDSVIKNRKIYQERRDALCGGFRKIGWNIPDSKGSMFVWAPIPKSYKNSVEFCFALLEKTGLICTPGSSFGLLGEGYVRFALVEPVEIINEIIDIVDKSNILK